MCVEWQDKYSTDRETEKKREKNQGFREGECVRENGKIKDRKGREKNGRVEVV